MDTSVTPLSEIPAAPAQSAPAAPSVANDQPVVVAKSKPSFSLPKINLSPKTRLVTAVLGIFILVGGLLGGYYLSQRRQIQPRASSSQCLTNAGNDPCEKQCAGWNLIGGTCCPVAGPDSCQTLGSHACVDDPYISECKLYSSICPVGSQNYYVAFEWWLNNPGGLSSYNDAKNYYCGGGSLPTTAPQPTTPPVTKYYCYNCDGTIACSTQYNDSQTSATKCYSYTPGQPSENTQSQQCVNDYTNRVSCGTLPTLTPTQPPGATATPTTPPTVSCPADTKPSDLAVFNITSSSVTISWVPGTGIYTPADLRISTSDVRNLANAGTANDIVRINLTDPNQFITGLQANTVYYYRFFAGARSGQYAGICREILTGTFTTTVINPTPTNSTVNPTTTTAPGNNLCTRIDLLNSGGYPMETSEIRPGDRIIIRAYTSSAANVRLDLLNNLGAILYTVVGPSTAVGPTFNATFNVDIPSGNNVTYRIRVVTL